MDVNNPDTLILRILSDNAGTPGSTVLGSFVATSNIFALGNYAFAPIAPITLSAGSYWLAAFPTSASSIYSWMATSGEVINGPSGWSIGTAYWTSNDLGATWLGDPTVTPEQGNHHSRKFAFEAAAVPEPSVMVLTLLATCGLTVAARRRPLSPAGTTPPDAAN